MDTPVLVYSRAARSGGTLYVAAAAAFVLFFVIGLGACRKKAEDPKPEALAPIKAGPGEVSSEALVRGEEQPPNVRVKRDSDGNYSWEITGKDVDRIIKADRALRKSLRDRQKQTP